MFPEELPKRLIKMFSFVGDTILDPFLGSGTTTLAAKNLGRNSIGYEINKKFLPIIKEKIGARTPNFLEDAEFEFITQNNIPKDWKIRIEALPYYFKDPVKFDRKIDPKKLQFGSKIDLSQTKKEKYYSVKRIISPEVVVLNTGIKVKLIGVKTKEEKTEEAINFLISKLKGQKVFLKFDTTKHDKDGNLLVYLYLKNKTFINAHLIKNGLADVDINMDFRYKNKFINLKE